MSQEIYNIFKCIQDLKMHTDVFNETLIVTSGGFDPLHVGHLRCFQESSKICGDLRYFKGKKLKFAVIVNGDGFLLRKKGKSFMREEERMEIIAGIRGVDYVVPWDDGSQTVVGALAVLAPYAFTKGGDRDTASNVPEFDLCEEIGCKVLFGIGGGKVQSSSWLVGSISNVNE